MANSMLAMLIPLSFFLINCGQTSSQQHDNHQSVYAQKDTCDRPDSNTLCCFINMPATLTSTMTIAGQEEAGDRLIISGTIFKADGKTPYPNIILYAYQTDRKGYYSKRGNEKGVQKWHGYLHGWCKTDNQGHYEIHSIRPARYPDNTIPAHIHAVVKMESGQSFYITDYVFKDDALVNEKYISKLTSIGGTGIVDLIKTKENTWIGKRDVVLKN